MGAGFAAVWLQLVDDREQIEFRGRLTDKVSAEGSESLLRLWIQVLRGAGFRVGFEELGITQADGTLITGRSFTAPIAEVAAHGAPEIEGA
jgi:hypothetical protein